MWRHNIIFGLFIFLMPSWQAEAFSSSPLSRTPASAFFGSRRMKLDTAPQIHMKSTAAWTTDRDIVNSWTGKPRDQDLKRGMSEVQFVKTLCSPVFFSTDPETHKVAQGLKFIPKKEEGRPMLFVGNHQLMGLDLCMLMPGIFSGTGILPRGMAHPIFWEKGMGGLPGGMPANKEGEEVEDYLNGNAYEAFGCVPSSAKNFYNMMKRGDTVILFPGGSKEALHGRGVGYRTQWPKNSADFMRVAAKFNAVIVPFGGIGGEEAFSVIAYPEEAEEFREKFKVLVQMFQKFWGLFLESSRKDGVDFAAVESNGRIAQTRDASDRLFLPQSPIWLPKSPFSTPRYYWKFDEPFDTSSVDPEDREACMKAYDEVRSRVEASTSYLLEKRPSDPYAFGFLGPRGLYEHLNKCQAPTFQP